jgi:HEAT repeats
MFIVRRRIIPFRPFALGVACAFATLSTTGCTSADPPPTPLTASFDMHPVPKTWGSGSIFDAPKNALNMMTGKTPLADVRKMEDKENPDARRQGIYALASKNWGQVEPYTKRYRQIAQTDTDAGVRAAAIRALNASRDRAAVPVFIAALSDANPSVRLQAAKALSNVPDASAVEALSRTLGNQTEQRDVRIAAAEALRHYRTIGVVRVLAGTLGGKDFGVAWQSRWSLRILTGRDFQYNERAWLEYLTSPGKPFG